MKARLALLGTLGMLAAGLATAAGAEPLPDPVAAPIATAPAAVTDSVVGAFEGVAAPVFLEDRFRPQLRIRQVTGDGVGYNANFTTAEVMFPFKLTDGYDQAFVDFRGVLNHNVNVWANAGAGWRWYSEDENRIYGGNLYFDFRDTDYLRYDQVGFGFESLGERWDFRANAYFPVGNDEARIATSTVVYDGGAVVDSVQVWEKALTGADFETGITISERFRLRAYVGGYYFYGDYTEHVWGAKARATVQPIRGFEIAFQYTYDRVFNDNFNVFFSFYFPLSNIRHHDSSYSLLDRMGDRVERLYNVVLDEQTRVFRTFN